MIEKTKNKNKVNFGQIKKNERETKKRKKKEVDKINGKN